MGAFTRQFSVCTWLRRVYQSSHSKVLHYYNDSYGMRFISNGYYNTMVGTNLQTFNVPGGEWFHECWLWNNSSLALTVYLNGEMITSGES